METSQTVAVTGWIVETSQTVAVTGWIVETSQTVAVTGWIVETSQTVAVTGWIMETSHSHCNWPDTWLSGILLLGLSYTQIQIWEHTLKLK